jgi:hypothetical protein
VDCGAPTWRARIALQMTDWERTDGEEEYESEFSDPMIAVFTELYMRSPFVVPLRPALPAGPDGVTALRLVIQACRRGPAHRGASQPVPSKSVICSGIFRQRHDY